MQYEKAQLERQQLILKQLKYYNGAVDGIWGPKSIDAKKAFESSTDFSPGIPSNGMPFKSVGPYPSGMSIARGRHSLLEHSCLSPAQQEVPVAKSELVAPPEAAPVMLSANHKKSNLPEKSAGSTNTQT